MRASVSLSRKRARVVSALGRRTRRKAGGRAWRRGALAIAGLLILVPLPTSAGQSPYGMVRYGHPVYHNGHRVLWHGAWRGGAGKSQVAAAESPKAAADPSAASEEREISVLADPHDDCATRMAGELVSTLRDAGLKARTVAGATSPNALAKAVVDDGADLAIAPMDALLADAKATVAWRDRAPYVARLANETIEIIASRTITDFAQLKDRQASLGPAVIAEGASAEALLARLGVKPKAIDGPLSASLEELAAGKIDAVVVAGAGHSQDIADFGKNGWFHLISIPWTAALAGGYAPVQLTAKDRANLIRSDEKVQTVAAPMALIAIDAAPGSARAPQFAAIVAAFFPKFDALLALNEEPSWREVNLAATANWPRLQAAQEWLASSQGVTDASLESFRKIAHSVALSNGGPGAADADRLYQSLMQWGGAAQ